jgi:hypothetical protein
MEVISRFIKEAAYDSKILAMKNRYPDAAQAIDWAKVNLKLYTVLILLFLNIKSLIPPKLKKC